MKDALDAVQARLSQAVRERSLPHAMLVVVERLEDGVALAEWLCGALLCTAFDGPRRCGHCVSCRLFDARNHPDVLRLAPEEGKTAITVSQIRGIDGFVHTGAHQGQAKTLLIAPAEAMNLAAANALLKTLEEPPARTWFVLVSRHPSLLPATVRSRCQRIARLPATSAADAGADPREASWQALDSGQASATALAEEWKSQPLGDTLAWLVERLAAKALAEARSSGPEAKTVACYDTALASLSALRRGIALNPQAAIEAVLLEYVQR